MHLRSIESKHCTTIPVPDDDHMQSSGSAKKSKVNGTHINGALDHPPNRLRLFVWSASDEEGLKRLSTVYESHLSQLCITDKGEEDEYLENLSYTLSQKRSSLPWKSFAIADTISNLRQRLSSQLSKPKRSSAAPTISFIFNGQGAQWPRMGRELFCYPTFQTSMRDSELYLERVGCTWALTGKFDVRIGFNLID